MARKRIKCPSAGAKWSDRRVNAFNPHPSRYATTPCSKLCNTLQATGQCDATFDR